MRSYRTWFPLILTGWACVLLASASASSQLPHVSGPRPSSTGSEAQQQPTPTVPVPAGIQQQPTAPNGQRAGQEKQQDRNDQRSEWREPIVIVTGAAVFIYLLILLVYLRQLTEMRESTEATKRSADAALKAAETAERAMKTQERPHVFVERVEFRYIDRSDTPPRPFTCAAVYRLKNYGKSPAWIKRHVMQFVMKETLPECPQYGFPDRRYGYWIPPGEDIPGDRPFDGPELTDTHWAELDAGRMKLFVYGMIEYTDKFDDTYTSRAAWMGVIERGLSSIPAVRWIPWEQDEYWRTD